MIDFAAYMKSYILIAVVFVVSNSIICLQYISPAGLIWPFDNHDSDYMPEYIIASTKVFLTIDTGSLQYRSSMNDGHGWAFYFILQTLLAKYLLDNCFVAMYIYIYASLVKQYTGKQNTIPLDFEKSTWQKKAMISKSVFFGAARRRKEIEMKKAEAEQETRRKLMFEAKTRIVMRGLEGQRLFTSALNRIFTNSKKKRTTLIDQSSLSIKEFDVIDENTHRGRRISHQNPRPSIRFKYGINSGAGYLKNKLTLNLDNLADRLPSDNNLMTDRTENLPTSETPREDRRHQKSVTSKFQTVINSKQINQRHTMQDSGIVPNRKEGIERAQSSTSNWGSPGRKARLLRKLSVIRETIKLTRPSKLVLWMGTPYFKRFSTIAASIQAILTTLTLKPLACINWPGYYPVLIGYSALVAYFLFEICCHVNHTLSRYT